MHLSLCYIQFGIKPTGMGIFKSERASQKIRDEKKLIMMMFIKFDSNTVFTALNSQQS